MKSAGLFSFSLVLMLAVPHSDLFASTLSCAGGIVSVGDSRVDLLAKCGEPDHKESHEEAVSERLDPGVRQKTYITVEDWTYNYGPTQFMRIVTLRNGKVSHIEAGNYGYTKGAKPSERECSEQIISRGDTTADVTAKCGAPSWKDVHQEEFKERLDSGLYRTVTVNVEEWTYNLGPNRFVRILTFRNGKLTDIRTGSYGY